MSQYFKPKCLATAIGSLPYKDPQPACDLVLKYLQEIPVAIELPNLGYKFTLSNCGPLFENAPALVDDEKREVFYFDTSKDVSGELEKFYENYLSNNLEYFRFSEERGIGFYSLIKSLNKSKLQPKYFKTQLPGPITSGLTIKDNKGKSIIYNEEFMQVIIKTIIMKAQWQIKEIKKVCPNIIFFFDEPGLVSYGSSYFNFDKHYIINTLNEIFSAVQVITGSHCCGNTDWSLLMESQVDIISFDAFTFSGALCLYPDQLKKFLSRNGSIAWGIIPNSNEIFKWSPEELINKFEKEIEILVQNGFSKEELLSSSLITPCCGLGTTTSEVAEEVLWTTQQVSLILREKYFKV